MHTAAHVNTFCDTCCTLLHIVPQWRRMNRIRKPVNTTVDPAIADDIRRRSDESKIPMGTLLEDAWLLFKGAPTPLTLARRQMLFGDAKPAKKAA